MEPWTTGYYLRIRSPVVDKVKVNKGIQVVLPNGKIIASTHETYLHTPQLLRDTRKSHIFPALSHAALISISQPYDEDYITVFDK